MKKMIVKRIVLAAIVIVSAAAATAQTGGNNDLHWNAIAAGGGTMSGNTYSMNGSAGQTAAAVVSCGASGYALHSGFWAGIPEGDVIFRNGFEAGC